MIKVAVYAIMCNEQKFYKQWLSSMWDNGAGADYICILDTGSDENWMELLNNAALEAGVPKGVIKISRKIYKPWRFDAPRNDSMKLIPDDADVCICTDLDETLISGWATDLRKCIEDNPKAGRVYYYYSWNGDETSGDPKRYFWYDKIHRNPSKGISWKWPVHETLVTSAEYQAKYPETARLNSDKIYLWHHPDPTKSRSNYLPLLELRAQEDPDDLYGLFYLAREYSFRNDWASAAKWVHYLELQLRKNGLENDDYCMMSAIYTLQGDCSRQMGDNFGAEFYYKRAVNEYPYYRDGYIKLAQLYAYWNKPAEAFLTLSQMVQNSKQISDWRTMDYYWRDWKVLQIKADALMWLKRYNEAKSLMEQAVQGLKTEQDKQEAMSEGFYNDYTFLQTKIAELENSSEKGENDENTDCS